MKAPSDSCVQSAQLSGEVDIILDGAPVDLPPGGSIPTAAVVGPWDLEIDIQFSSEGACGQCTAATVAVAANSKMADSAVPQPRVQLRTNDLLQIGSGENFFTARFDQAVSADLTPMVPPVEFLTKGAQDDSVTYVQNSFARASALEFTFLVAYAANANRDPTNVALILVPGAAINSQGVPCSLAKFTFFVAPTAAALNPPLLGSRDLGTTNLATSTIDVVFGACVRGLTAGSFVATPHSAQVAVASKRLVPVDPSRGIYRLVLEGLTGEGTIEVSIPDGRATLDGEAVRPTTIALERGVTPPVGSLRHRPVDPKSFVSFGVVAGFSEPVIDTGTLALVVSGGSGQASISQLKPSGPGLNTNFSCDVYASSSEDSRRKRGTVSGALELTLSADALVFSDLAGNDCGGEPLWS